jgi:hypothetical protein
MNKSIRWIRNYRVPILVVLAVLDWTFGSVIVKILPESFAFELWFGSWLCILILIAYHSTPSNSAFGKVFFGFSVLIILGVAMKLLHLIGANAVIISGLLGILIAYLLMWSRAKERSE